MCLDSGKWKNIWDSRWRGQQEMLEKNYYGIIKTKRKGESVSTGICDNGSAVLSGLYPLFQMLFSCGSPSSQQVLPAWLSPLSRKSSFWSAGCFSLLLIHFVLLPGPSSCYQSILQSPSPRFSQQYFHSSLLNVSPLGYPFKQVPKPTGLGQTSHNPRFTILQDGNGKATGYWELVFTF